MASITKYRADTWRAVIRRTGFKPVSSTFNNKAQAEAWARKIEAEMDARIYRDIKATARDTVRAIFVQFRDEVSPNRRGARWEITRINRILRTAGWADRRLDQLTPEDIREWRNDRLKEVAASSVNRELNLMSGIFTHAIKEWSAPMKENPVHLVSRPAGSDKARSRRWTQREIDAVLKVSGWAEDKPPQVGRDYVGWAVLLAIETAMRLGELTSIRVVDFDAEARAVHLDITKNGDSRSVPLSSKALRWLTFLTAGREPDEKLIPLTSESLGLYFRQVRDEAGLTGLHFHDTRHEAATRLSKKLANVLELSAVTGHRSLQSLKRYYNPSAAELAAKLD